MKRVVVTGMAGLTPIGADWIGVAKSLKDRKSGIRYMSDWESFNGLST